MYTVFDKDTIEMEIVPLIPKSKQGFPPTVPLAEIINAILYKLKTGVQWYQLPVKTLFERHILTWNEPRTMKLTNVGKLTHEAIIGEWR